MSMNGREGEDGILLNDTDIHNDDGPPSHPILPLPSSSTTTPLRFSRFRHLRGRLPPRFVRILDFLIPYLGPLFHFLKPHLLIDFWYQETNEAIGHPTAYLNGVRGLAALFVTLHHYELQFVPALLEGYASEHDNYWLLQLPLIRYVHSGRCVEVFFLLSGYVLSLGGLRYARRGEQKKFTDSLSSSVFRRWFRLWIPAIAAMGITFFFIRWKLWQPIPDNWMHLRVPPPPTAKPNPIPQIPENAGTAAVAARMVNNATEALTPTVRFVWFSSPLFMQAYDPSFFRQLWGWWRTVLLISDPLNVRGMGLLGAEQYDTGPLWTIPVEWSGSLMTYLLVLGLGLAKNWVRVVILVYFTAWGYITAQGMVVQFVAGVLLAELSLWKDGVGSSSDPLTANGHAAPPPPPSSAIMEKEVRGKVLGKSWEYASFYVWLIINVMGFYIGSYPILKAKRSPGYITLALLLESKGIVDPTKFLCQISSFMIISSLVLCVPLRRPYQSKFCQYLGRISFSLYLLHVQILWTVGTRAFPFAMMIVGGGNTQIQYFIGMVIGAAITGTFQLCLCDVFTRAIDDNAIWFAKFVEIKFMKLKR